MRQLVKVKFLSVNKRPIVKDLLVSGQKDVAV